MRLNVVLLELGKHLGVSDFISLDISPFSHKYEKVVKNFGDFQEVENFKNFLQNFQTFLQFSTSSRKLLKPLRAFLSFCGTMVAYRCLRGDSVELRCVLVDV